MAGLGIVLMSYFPQKIFSQHNFDRKKNLNVEVRGDVGRNVFKNKNNNLFSELYVKGNQNGEKCFSGIECQVDEFALNNFSKVGFGVNVYRTENFGFNPEMTFTREICLVNEKDTTSNRLENKFGPGLKLEYNLGKFKGSNEVIFPIGEFDKPRYYIRNSVEIGKGEIELFLRGRNIDENYFGIKYTTKEFWKDFRFFAEYAVKNNPKIYTTDFMNIGISLNGK